MSSDVLAAAPSVALSPHTLAAALNGVAPALAPAPAARAALPVAAPLPEPGVDEDAEEPRAGMLMFRLGAELFAAPLGEVDEAIELPEVTPLPEMPPHMLGVLRLRGAMLPLYSPAASLGLVAGAPTAALIVRDGERRIAIAIDDVEDVIELREADLRATPDASDDRLLVAVARHDGRLVSAIDVRALVTACASGIREIA